MNFMQFNDPDDKSMTSKTKYFVEHRLVIAITNCVLLILNDYIDVNDYLIGTNFHGH